MAYVQGNTVVQSGYSTTGQISLDSGTTTGNLIVVYISVQGTGVTISQVTDNATPANTYTQATSRIDSYGNRTAVYYCHNCTGKASPHTITVTASVSSAWCLGVAEFDSIATADSLDGSSSANDYATNMSSGSTATTAQADELLVGAYKQSSLVVTASGLGDGTWNAVDAPTENTDETFKLYCFYQYVSSTGAYSIHGTLSADAEYNAHIATFKVAAGGGGGSPGTISSIITL